MPNAEQLEEMRSKLVAYKAEAAAADTAVKQRGEQFSVMRNDVFGTNKAVELSVTRLQTKGASPQAIEKFKLLAESRSTPEQIETLENETAP